MSKPTPITQKMFPTLHILLSEGHTEKALNIAQDILKEHPEDISILNCVASLYAQKQAYSKAIETIQKALSLANTHPGLYNTAGNIYLKKQDWEKAIQLYRKALDLKENYAQAHNNLAYAYTQQKKYDISAMHYEKAIATAPTYAEAYYNYSILTAMLGKRKEAIILLKKAISYKKSYYPAYKNLAALYLENASYDEAEKYYTLCLSLNTKDPSVYFGLGQLYLKRHILDKAKRAFQESLALDSQQPVYSQLGLIALLEEDHELALTHYLQQLSVAPAYQDYYNTGILLMQKNRQQEAIPYLESAHALEPHNLEPIMNLGALYLGKKNNQRAIYWYQKAQEQAPENAEIRYILQALKQKHTPPSAPQSYLKNLFNQYAPYYDKHLSHLKYTVPQQVKSLLASYIPYSKTREKKQTILDLGCGTGLAGEIFADWATHLIGVDVSEKMLHIAKSKQCYHILDALDLTEGLQKYIGNDLVLATDVFTYLGDLKKIHYQAYNALRPEGYFAYSVEKSTNEKKPYTLQCTLRYMHTKKYIEHIAQTTGFILKELQGCALREHHTKTTPGYLILLQRPK